MRIAIYHDLPSGGAKRTLYESVKRLAHRHTLDVYTLDTEDKSFCDLREFTNTEFVFHFSPAKLFHSPFGRLNQFQRWSNLQRLDRLARHIAKVIDKNKYDIVLAHPCMWTQAPLVLRYLQTPTIYYCHEPPRNLYDLSPTNQGFKRDLLDYADPLIWLYHATARKFDRLAVQSATKVLVNSKFIQDQVNRFYGIDAAISYHGVDTDVFCPNSERDALPFILSVGAIQPHKGFDFLIESIGYIDRKVRLPLYLVGNMENPEYQGFLKAKARERGVDLSIEVRIDQETLVRRYNGATLVAYAPYNEPFGLVPLEAMSCCKPVVGVDEGGIRETVANGLTGILVERDPKKFGNAIQLLLENTGLADQYGMNGRKYVLENWSWEKAVSSLEQHLYGVIQ
jgi:glycosyltransferase involved in cell wall biosynthesis